MRHLDLDSPLCYSDYLEKKWRIRDSVVPSVTDPRSPTAPYLGALPPSHLGYIIGEKKTSVF